MIPWATARWKSLRYSLLLALPLLCFATQSASADFISINIDYGTISGTPAATYGAAASQPGFWNNPADGTTAAQVLMDLAGGPTGVTIAMSEARFEFNIDNPLTGGDDQALLDDSLDLGDAAPTTFTIAGLSPGLYDVFTYAWAPDDELARTSVSVNGSAAQPVGGVFPGSHALGITYAHHQVKLLAGNLVITATPEAGFGALNGIQITATSVIPEPSTLLLGGLGAGFLAIGRFRRRKRSAQEIPPV